MDILLQFQKFVLMQDADRKIDHRAWSTCAVGEFVKDRDITSQDVKLVIPDKPSVHDRSSSLRRALGNGAHKTYGDLAKEFPDVRLNYWERLCKFLR